MPSKLSFSRSEERLDYMRCTFVNTDLNHEREISHEQLICFERYCLIFALKVQRRR